MSISATPTGSNVSTTRSRFQLSRSESNLADRIVMTFLVVLTHYQRWQCNARTRKHLRNLPGYLRQDIGLTAGEIERELRKPFWRD